MCAQSESSSREVLIGLGSNIHPEHFLPAALDLLTSRTSALKRSTIWQSPAVGSAGPDYLNAAVLIQTALPLSELQSTVLGPIEMELGRIRSEDKFSDRTIDLDVLVYRGEVVDEELWTQAHAAVPASQIYPDLINPFTGESLLCAARRLTAQSKIHERQDLSFP